RLARLRALGRKIQESEAVPAAAPVQAVPEAPARKKTTRLHLRFTGDGPLHRFEGRLTAPGGVRHFHLVAPKELDAVWRDADGSLRFRVQVADGTEALWAEVEPAAELVFELSTDGRAGGPLRVGPYGLPLVDAGRIAGDDLALL